MNWNSPAEFFAMGGYALYVWGSVLACLVAIAFEVAGVRGRRRAALAHLRRQRLAHELDQRDLDPRDASNQPGTTP